MDNVEKRNLYFQRSNGEYRLLGENVTDDDAWKLMKAFMDEHNFKCYYIRSWEKNGIKWYDVGSHTEFFLWTNKEL